MKQHCGAFVVGEFMYNRCRLGSKTAREKRKRELIGLRSENKRLREERVEFQKKIRLLEEKVDLFRDQASANIQLENEILRAQLEEHKKFVGGFMKLG